MQNGTYPWVTSSSLSQKSWPPGYQASLTDLFLKKNPLHFRTGISQLAAASTYIEKMSSLSDNNQKCPHPDSKDKPYPCDICQQYFTLCTNLRTECTSSGNNTSVSTPLNTSISQDRKPMSLLTSLGERSESTASVTSPGVQRNRPPSTKQFPCQICQKYFTQKGNLKTHMMIHTGEKPYSCQICGKCFTQKGNVDTHMKIHTGEKDFGCDTCGKRFTQKGNLKTHVRSVHTKEKPFACGICGKSFSQKGNMQTHVRTHNKDDRFPCTLCGKTFSQKGNLKTHMQRHTGQLPSRRSYISRSSSKHSSADTLHTAQTISRLPSFNGHPSTTQSSPLHSDTPPKSAIKLPLDISNSRTGLSLSYNIESQLDCKPQLTSSAGTPMSPHQSDISSPSPGDELTPPSSIHKPHHPHLQQNHLSLEALSQAHMHTTNTNHSRITSPIPLSIASNPLSNADSDSRPFYSAPPTPVPGATRWLPHAAARHYESFQPHSGLSSYNVMSQHTNPLSQLSLFASNSMSHHLLGSQAELEKQSPSSHTPHSQIHNEPEFHNSRNPDFSQLLD